MKTRQKHYPSPSSKNRRCPNGTRKSKKTATCEKSKCQKELDAIHAQLKKQKEALSLAFKKVDNIYAKVDKIDKI